MLEPSTFSQLGPYLKLLEMIRQGVLLVDESGKIIGLNALAQRQLNYPSEELEGITIFEINPHYTLLRWRKLWRRLIKGERVVERTEFINQQDIVYPVEMETILLSAGKLNVACILVENLLETNRYRDLLDVTTKISRIGCWELDFINHRATFTREAFSLFDLDEEEESFSFEDATRLLKNLFKPEDYDRLLLHSKNAVKKGEAFDLECTVHSPMGQKHVLRIKGEPQFSEERASKLYGTLQDISQINSRSENLFIAKFVLEQMRDLIFWIRQDGSIFYANEAACTTLSTTRKQVTASNIWKWLPELNDGKDWPTYWEQLKAQRTKQSESTLTTRRSKKIPVELNHHFLTWDSQEFDCLIVRNLAKKKERDALIEMVNFTLNQSSDLIFWTDRQAMVIYFNESVPKKLGYSEAFLQKATLFDINPDLTPDSFEAYWNEMAKKGRIENEHPFYRSDGSAFYVEAAATYIYYRGQECCCITMRDITQRKEKEEELHRAMDQIQALRDKAETQKTYLQEEVTSDYNFNNIISKSTNYHQILKQVAQVADTSSTVLIQGETGTGKELLARAIHGMSNRDESPLVKVNCAALPTDLIESELFGHEKGAFTGAYQQKIGKFELADGGTIFLDEVGEMPLELQPKLLRVLQEGEFERVGLPKTHQVDVRVIAATNRDLETMVREGTFRQDLYFRLNVFPIYNLPLRERKEDIPLLIQHFLKKYNARSGKQVTKVDEKMVQKLQEYEFPGNIRELENLVERGVIISNGEELDLKSIMPDLRSTGHDMHYFPTLEEVEQQHILEALRRCQGRITGNKGAAKLLGMNGKTLASRMRKWGIGRMDFLEKDTV
jgi:PAS domain S-box-containing protein